MSEQQPRRGPEKRVAPDGQRYAKSEFISYFGGTREWECAAQHSSPAVQSIDKADGGSSASAANLTPLSNKQLKIEAVKVARREAKVRDRSGAGAREHAEALATPFTIVSEGWDRLTVEGIKAVVTYTNDRASVDAWCAQRIGASTERVFMGLDTETKPSLFPGDKVKAPALLQLALRVDEQCAVLLFAICHYDGGSPSWPAGLVALLNDPCIYKSGVGVEGDVRTLQKYFPGLCDEVQPEAMFDVATALTKVQKAGGGAPANARDNTQSLGLKSLGALLYSDAQHTRLLECPVDHRSTLSDWEKHPLDGGQQVYSALDAVLSHALALDAAAQLAQVELGQTDISQALSDLRVGN